MIGIYIILAHLCGDYLFQNQWMAERKTKSPWIATLHGFIYMLCYVPITQHIPTLFVIWATHNLIDHFRLIKSFIWLRNQLAPKEYRYRYKAPQGWRGPRMGPFGASEQSPYDTEGYYKATSFALNFWLMVIADNTIHLLINVGAIRWLG